VGVDFSREQYEKDWERQFRENAAMVAKAEEEVLEVKQAVLEQEAVE